MTNNNQITNKQTLELDNIDRQIINIKQANPDMNRNQIGNRLKDIGSAKSNQLAYVRMRKSDYLTAEYEQIERQNNETMGREIVPIALKLHKKALKDKDMTLIEKKEFIFQAERVGMQDSTPPEAQALVNIESVQVLINQSLDRD